jgi:hypothetical protein
MPRSGPTGMQFLSSPECDDWRARVGLVDLVHDPFSAFQAFQVISRPSMSGSACSGESTLAHARSDVGCAEIRQVGAFGAHL